MRKKIRVLIVDDSMLFTKLLKDRLSQYDYIEIVGNSMNAFDAERKILSLHPDVVTLDVEMPQVSGIDFLKKFLPKHHVPVVMVSGVNITVFEALSSGAVDFVRKPDLGSNAVDNFIRDLCTKIYIASMAKVRSAPVRPAVEPASTSLIGLKNTAYNNSTIIALGASTGGTEATLTVLKSLPANTPGMVIVQHMPEGFTNMYAQRLNKLCEMEVREAKDGDKIVRGLALIAPGDKHMKVVKRGLDYYVSCFHGEKVSGHRPSVDVLFNSMAENVGMNSVGIIMTGMGQDGAKGLLEMRKKGAHTIGQDKESCVVYGMPMVAFNIGGVKIQASCENIANVLKNHLNSK